MDAAALDTYVSPGPDGVGFPITHDHERALTRMVAALARPPRSKEPVLIDEWQEVPAVLGAVKRAVDSDSRPGRFILTGSVEAEWTATTWPGTGRVVRLVLHGLTQREIARRDAGSLVSTVMSGRLADLEVPIGSPTIDGYVDLAARSGFPDPALRLAPSSRDLWLDSYIDHVVTRDVAVAGETRDPALLRRYLEVLALSSAGLPADNTLIEGSGVHRRTANAYDRLLSRLFLLDLIPAWASNRLHRLLKRPKRYLTDPALMLAGARIDRSIVLMDTDLLGRLLDTFVVAQLRPELDVFHPRARLHHLRTEGGRQEVDVIIDLGAGRVIGIEVKVGLAPTARDARHLVWLRDELGARFIRGIVLHTGTQPFELGERLWALPIATLWGAPPA